MPHLFRFHAQPQQFQRETVRLTGPEAHHAIHVVRVEQDQRVLVFDGEGKEWTGAVEATGRNTVEIRLEACRTHPTPVPLILLQAALRRDKATEELIRRGTELGVTCFVFWRAAHSERAPKVSDKWTNWAMDACKQSGRCWIPDFRCLPNLEEALSLAEGTILIASTGVPPIPLRDCSLHHAVSIMIGPEGDWTHGEQETAHKSGAIPISLGVYTYRAEAAAATLATLVQYERGQLGPLPR